MTPNNKALTIAVLSGVIGGAILTTMLSSRSEAQPRDRTIIWRAANAQVTQFCAHRELLPDAGTNIKLTIVGRVLDTDGGMLVHDGIRIDAPPAQRTTILNYMNGGALTNWRRARELED